MKTKSFFAIAIEALVTVSLIALLGLLTALVYALLSFLSPATATQTATAPQMTEPTAQPLTSAKPALASTIYALPEAKEAPKLETEPMTETVTQTDKKPDYAKMTTRELRPLARDRKIAKWNKLNKQELIAALSA